MRLASLGAALQFKIRKIEDERSIILQQCSEMQDENSSVFEEDATQREVEARASTATKNKNRIQLERILAEKTSLEARVLKVKERNSTLQTELNAAAKETEDARMSKHEWSETFELKEKENTDFTSKLAILQKSEHQVSERSERAF
tara:strand:+ start:275 stop:712 length:438 start_codon:yes stop_codon:yes gene_type:complete